MLLNCSRGLMFNYFPQLRAETNITSIPIPTSAIGKRFTIVMTFAGVIELLIAVVNVVTSITPIIIITEPATIPIIDCMFFDLLFIVVNYSCVEQ